METTKRRASHTHTQAHKRTRPLREGERYNCRHKYTYIHTHTYIHNTYIRTYTYIHTYTHIHRYICTYVHTHIYTYIHIHIIYTYIHTHTCIHIISYHFISYQRVQRMMNIKTAKAFRTSSYEALCVLAGVRPIRLAIEE